MFNYQGSSAEPADLRINTASAGDTILVAATSGKATRVYAYDISVGGATVIQLKRGTTILRVWNFAGAGGLVIKDLREKPYFTTALNEAFTINSSNAVQVDGGIEYTTG